MKKRILSFLLCCVMLVGLLPAMAFAEDGSTPEKGGSTPEKVSVTFDVNDPDNTILKSVSKRQFSISYSYGSAATVEPTNSDTYCIWYNGLICEAKDGIVFKEWNTKPDGTGTAYREGETISETLTQDLTLYAIWAQSADISLEKTVEFPNGDTPASRLPEYFSFSLRGVSSDPRTLYADLDESSRSPLWTGSKILAGIQSSGIVLRAGGIKTDILRGKIRRRNFLRRRRRRVFRHGRHDKQIKEHCHHTDKQYHPPQNVLFPEITEIAHNNPLLQSPFRPIIYEKAEQQGSLAEL